jgi:hypothetical protein
MGLSFDLKVVQEELHSQECPLVTHYYGIPIREFDKEDFIKMISLEEKSRQEDIEEGIRRMEFFFERNKP